MDIVEARKNARYTQQQAADILGISRPTYARMEKNPGDITVDDANKIAKIFGIKVADIFFANDCN